MVKHPQITLYLIHIEPPYKHAKHYLGVTRGDRSVDDRLAEHRAGRGARLCRAAVGAGCTLVLARVWLNAPWRREKAI